MDACRCCRVVGWIHHIRPINELIERLFVCKVIRLKFVSFFSSSNNGGKTAVRPLKSLGDGVCVCVCMQGKRSVFIWRTARDCFAV